MKADKVLAEIKEAVKKSMAYDELNRKFQLITNKSADEVLQRLTQTGLPSNDTQNVRGLPKLALLHELAKFYPDTPEGLGITLDAKFTGIGSVEYNHKQEKPPKLPPHVVAWVGNTNEDPELLFDYIVDSESHDNEIPDDVFEWIFGSQENMLLILRVIKDDIYYEVEEEPKFEVVLFDNKTDRLLLMELNEHDCHADWECNNDGYRSQWFTEKQIKEFDERFWAFAVPVEEVNYEGAD